MDNIIIESKVEPVVGFTLIHNLKPGCINAKTAQQYLCDYPTEVHCVSGRIIPIERKPMARLYLTNEVLANYGSYIVISSKVIGHYLTADEVHNLIDFINYNVSRVELFHSKIYSVLGYQFSTPVLLMCNIAIFDVPNGCVGQIHPSKVRDGITFKNFTSNITRNPIHFEDI